MVRSIEPDAMLCAVGSKRVANTSPEWPVNSMIGAASPLVLGIYSQH